MLRNLDFVLAGLIALVSMSVQAAAVTGDFTLGGKPLKPAEVAAFRIRDQFAPREFETYVMLTTRPVDKQKISGSLDAYATAINDPAVSGQADYIALSVHKDGKTTVNAHVGGVQYVDSSGTIMGQQGSLSATCKENTPARVACTVKTMKEVKPADGSGWTLDVSFDSDVLMRPVGKPMGANGEAPGKALFALRTAIAGNDLGKLLALLTPETGKRYNEDYNTPEENLKSAKEILDVRVPKQPKITGGEWLADDHALLEVEGMPFPNSRMLYLVEMRRVGEKWVYDDATPVGMLR